MRARIFIFGIIAALLTLMLPLSLVGCGGSPTIEEPGSLRAFAYSYGSYNEGYWDFDIKPEEQGGEIRYRFIATGHNGVEMDVDQYIDQSVMDDLALIIYENDIRFWNGFAEHDDSILDGYEFGLAAVYADGSLIAAGGYMKYPDNYRQGHDALSAYLNALAADLGNSQGVIGTPLFTYLGAHIEAFAENFDTDFPVSVSVRHDTEASGIPFETTRSATIRAVFIALRTITVIGEGGPAHTDDYLVYTFKMADGREYAFSFQQGYLLEGTSHGQQILIDGFDALAAVLSPPS